MSCACGGGCPRCNAESDIQRKISAGHSDDIYEREADRIADRLGSETISVTPTDAGGPIVSSGLQQRIQAASPGGESLAPSLRLDMESQLRADLSDVRVHRDAEAVALNRTLDARAFTVGNHVWLGGGESPSDRKLMAHELVHTVQQSGPSAAPTIQRAPKVAAQEWTVDHSDVVGIDEETAINVAVEYLGINETAAQFYGDMLEQRPLWASKKGLYVRAIDFLRDNRQRFDVTDVPAMLERALDFCDASSATVATLTDSFYEDLLIRAVYAAPPGSATFTHRTFNTVYEIPGRPAGTKDFAPSGKFGSLLRPDPNPIKPLTGGAGDAGGLLFRYGTAPGTLSSKETSEFIGKHMDRIPPPLRSALEQLASDPVIHGILGRFFGDGGQFKVEAVALETAHYTPGKKPQIEVDPKLLASSEMKKHPTPIGLRATLAHELYHYALDRADAFITESGASGSGNDHFLIEIVEDRYTIIEALRTGRSLLDEKIHALEGYIGPEQQPLIEGLFKANDVAGLRAHIRRDDFLDSLAFANIMRAVGINQLAISGELERSIKDMLLDPAQVNDLLYLSAINAVIIRKAFALAADIAERKNLALSAVWTDKTFIREIGSFIAALISKASGNRREGIVALSADI
jgi:hypothetical protein